MTTPDTVTPGAATEIPDAWGGATVFLSGQALTSRTETLEDFFRPRVRELWVAALASAYTRQKVAAWRRYAGGALRASGRLAQFPAPSGAGVLHYAGVAAAFILYVYNIARTAFRTRETLDVFIGVSCFSALIGCLLKRIGRVRRVVYYCLDYYPLPSDGAWLRWVVRRIWALDAFCARSADVVWDISPRIPAVRAELGRLPDNFYRKAHLPLTYRASLLRAVPRQEVERWTIGFVGTLSRGQGLQLLMEGMPDLVAALPGLHVRIVGRGPYANEFESLVHASGYAARFTFHGFIPEEEDVLRIISRCALGLATWPGSADNNILYADPGKPKLYACLGVPCVITEGPDIAATLQSCGAGRSIPYERVALVSAIREILSDDEHWAQYRRAAAELGTTFTTERVLPAVLSGDAMATFW